AVVGSKKAADLSDLQGHTLNSDRVIFVGPGITVTDRAATPTPENPNREAKLSGAYTAAAVAGLIASFEPHTSPTNKVLNVNGLETVFSTPQLRSLVQSRVLALEKRDGFRIVKGITTSTDTAWHQITTRRIVDYAKAGVRSAANPFIGKLNNERVRGALRSSINSFLADMIESEMLISYELDVSATRQQEIRGIVQVTMVLRPTFSIDFIRVTIFLE
ncbi:phage tail sheath protein, partial [bacterium]